MLARPLVGEAHLAGNLVHDHRTPAAGMDRQGARLTQQPLILASAAESGITYVVRAGDKLEVVAQNDLGAPILASPAVLDGRLYLRTAEELVCIGTSPRAGQK